MDQNFEGRDDPVLSKFENMLRSDEVYFFESEEFVSIIEFYLDNINPNKAQKAILIATEQYPADIDIKFLHVEFLIIKNQLDKALMLLNELQNIDPQNEEVYIQKAAIHSKKTDHQKAISFLKLALKQVSDSEDIADISSLLGMEYMFSDNLSAAKNCFIECLKENKNDHTSLYRVVHCFEFLEEYEDAVAFLNSYIENNPYSEIAWHQLSRQYVHLNMLEEALASIDFAIYSDDRFVGAYIEKAKILENIGKYEESIEIYQVVLSIESPSAYTYLRVGKCYEKLKNIDLAKTYFQKCVHEDPLCDKGWMALAELNYHLKDYEKVRSYVQKAIDVDSENILYWMLGAESNFHLNLYNEAIIAYKRVIELGFTDVATCCKLIDIYILMEDYQEALSFAKKRYQMFPDDVLLQMRLVAICFKMGNIERGSLYLSDFVEKNLNIKTQILQTFPFLKEYQVVINILSLY